MICWGSPVQTLDPTTGSSPERSPTPACPSWPTTPTWAFRCRPSGTKIGLHCAPVGPDCDLEVAGFSLVGVPAVVLGHNDRIAWGVTNLAADVQDLYIEKINPDNADQYEVNGRWVDMDVYTETLIYSGKKTDIDVRVTRHGPIISDSYGALEDFDEETSLDLPDDYAIALKWTALEPTRMVEAILGINTASNWEEFRQALQPVGRPVAELHLRRRRRQHRLPDAGADPHPGRR